MSTISTVDARQPAITGRRFQPHPADHRFFSTMAIVASLTIAAGFSSTYLPKVASGSPALPSIIHLHALIFGTWLAVFVAQALLVLTGRTALHRRVGSAAMSLAGLMLVVGTWTTIVVTREGHRGIPGVEFPDAGGFLLLNLNAIIVFVVLVAAGWYHRRNLQAHKRLMLMAVMGGLIGPGVSRLPFAAGRTPVIALLALAFLFAGPVYDFVTRRRVHPAYWWSLAASFLVLPPVVVALASTAAWHRVADWLLR